MPRLLRLHASTITGTRVRGSTFRGSALCALLAAATACENATGPRGDAGDFRLVAVGDTARAGEVGAAVQPVVVRLTAGGRPLRGVYVSWASGDAGVPDGGRSLTDADGQASMGWTLGPAPGTYRLTGSAPGAGEVSFTASAVAGAFARVRITPTRASLADVGDSVALSAVGTDRFGNRVTAPPLLWRALHPQIASVSATGVVRGLNGGTAAIVAGAGAIADTATVVVQQQPASVALLTHAATLRALGATVTLPAAVRDRLGNEIPGVLAAWSSLDTMVARVDTHGTVTAVRNGVARVRVAAGLNADTARVTVAQEPVRLLFQPASAGLAAGDSLSVLPMAYDSLGHAIAQCVLAWASADSSIAQVLRPGWIRGLRAGTTSVTASYGAVSATLAVTVRAGAIASAVIVPSSATLQVGETLTFAINFLDASGNLVAGLSPVWVSSDTNKLRVSASGVATARAVGVVSVTGSGAGRSATALVNIISAQPAGVRVFPERDTLNYLGATAQLGAAVTDRFGVDIAGLVPSWEGLDPALVSVSPSGQVKALAGSGSLARAVATYGPFRDTALVLTRQVARAIAVDPVMLSLHPADSAAIALTVGPDSGGSAITSLAATEANSAIARVSWSGGLPYVHGVAAGTTIVSFTAGGSADPAAVVTVVVSAPGPAVVRRAGSADSPTAPSPRP